MLSNKFNAEIDNIKVFHELQQMKHIRRKATNWGH